MKREYALIGAAVVVVVLTVLLALFVPGTLAEDERSESVPEGDVHLSEIRLTPTNVTENSATLTVTNWLSHKDGTSKNVSMLVRAVDTDDGLVKTRKRQSVGELTGDRDDAIEVNVTVERSGGYRFETLVFVDGERRDTRSVTVDGIEGLEPASAKSGLRFHDFGSLFPTITYEVTAVDSNNVTLNTRAFLTNRGDQTTRDLQLLVRARQGDSNVIADRAVTDVPDVRPGRTGTPTVNVTVPANYSYQLDAVLTRDDVLVDTAAAAANLDPTQTVEVSKTTESIDLDVEDFVRDDQPSDGGRDTPESTTVSGGGDGPGFGLVAGLTGLLVSALVFRHSGRDTL